MYLVSNNHHNLPASTNTSISAGIILLEPGSDPCRSDGGNSTGNAVQQLVYSQHVLVQNPSYRQHFSSSRQNDPRRAQTAKTDQSEQSSSSNTERLRQLSGPLRSTRLNTASCSWYAWNSPQLKKTQAGNKQPCSSSQCSQSAQLLPSHSVETEDYGGLIPLLRLHSPQTNNALAILLVQSAGRAQSRPLPFSFLSPKEEENKLQWSRAARRGSAAPLDSCFTQSGAPLLPFPNKSPVLWRRGGEISTITVCSPHKQIS